MARALAPALVTPDDIIEYDCDGNPCKRRGPLQLPRAIHPRRDLQGETRYSFRRAQPFAFGDTPFGLVGVPMQAIVSQRGLPSRRACPCSTIRKKFGATEHAWSATRQGRGSRRRHGQKNVRAHARARQRGLRADAADGGVRAVYTEVNARIQHLRHWPRRSRGRVRAGRRGLVTRRNGRPSSWSQTAAIGGRDRP